MAQTPYHRSHFSTASPITTHSSDNLQCYIGRISEGAQQRNQTYSPITLVKETASPLRDMDYRQELKQMRQSISILDQQQKENRDMVVNLQTELMQQISQVKELQQQQFNYFHSQMQNAIYNNDKKGNDELKKSINELSTIQNKINSEIINIESKMISFEQKFKLNKQSSELRAKKQFAQVDEQEKLKKLITNIQTQFFSLQYNFEKSQQKLPNKTNFVYHIDMKGFLMDDYNNYILDDYGEMIQIDEQQFKLLAGRQIKLE